MIWTRLLTGCHGLVCCCLCSVVMIWGFVVIVVCCCLDATVRVCVLLLGCHGLGWLASYLVVVVCVGWLLFGCHGLRLSFVAWLL